MYSLRRPRGLNLYCASARGRFRSPSFPSLTPPTHTSTPCYLMLRISANIICDTAVVSLDACRDTGNTNIYLTPSHKKLYDTYDFHQMGKDSPEANTMAHGVPRKHSKNNREDVRGSDHHSVYHTMPVRWGQDDPARPVMFENVLLPKPTHLLRLQSNYDPTRLDPLAFLHLLAGSAGRVVTSWPTKNPGKLTG